VQKPCRIVPFYVTRDGLAEVAASPVTGCHANIKEGISNAFGGPPKAARQRRAVPNAETLAICSAPLCSRSRLVLSELLLLDLDGAKGDAGKNVHFE
jgi:hypothetical protein